MIRNLCHKETGGNLYFTFGNSQFLFYFHRFISKKKKHYNPLFIYLALTTLYGMLWQLEIKLFFGEH